MFRKKALLTFIGLLILYSQTIFAQLVGIKAGPVYNHFMSEQKHVKGNIGLTAGVDYTHSFAEKIVVTAGLEYLQLGGGLFTIEDDTRYGLSFNDAVFPVKYRDAKVTLHTVNVPVLVNYAAYKSECLNLKVGIGPEVGYLISAVSNETITGPLGSGMYGTYNDTYTETSNYEAFNLAAALNIRLEFPVANHQMFIDYRYRYAITPVRKDYSYLDLNQNQSDIQQGSFIMTIGYALNLTKSSE